MKYSAFLNNYYNLSALILKFPMIKESLVSDMSDLQYKAQFEVDNSSEFASVDNPNSILSNTPQTYYSINIKDNYTNKILCEGAITQIVEKENGLADVITLGESENLKKELKTSLINKSLSEIAYSLSAMFNINYDTFSWECSNKWLGANISVVASEDNPLTLIDLLQNLSQSLGLWIYIKNGVIFCYPFSNQDNEGYKIELSSSDILNADISKSYDKLINNYTIKHYIDGVVSDEKNDNIGSENRKLYGNKPIDIDGSSSATVIIPNDATAVKIGNSYINRFGRMFDIITMDVESEIADYVDLVDVIKIKKFDKRYVLIDKEYDLTINKCALTLWEV